ERRITIDEGTNTLVGPSPDQIVAVATQILDEGGKAGRIPDLWDGHASDRLVDILREGIIRR
ncbi:MAG TPA: UDP-N-acetylglucosamine 2-epimerase (non-hydrolyzing), partial [Candidatus Latescibacteria bacterium]|nr:UDP-N-acetylglucosamine 2-epimerase (non-hydrolyzing) [Candidatus Latescibacterota bacterium]